MKDRAWRRAVAVAVVFSALAALLVVVARRSSPRQPPADVALPSVPGADEKVAVNEPAAPEREPQAAAPVAPPPSTFDEGELMSALRSARDNDPALAVELAREGNRRFPSSTDVPERTSILIHALAAQGLSSEARGAAEEMVNESPDSAWVREIEKFTGAHRHRNVRADEQGRLHFYDPPRT